MDFQELKDIIQRDGGKIIIVENDKPQLVVMSFEEYKAKIKGQPAQSPKGTVAGPPESSEARFGGEREREELTIDDLPLS